MDGDENSLSEEVLKKVRKIEIVSRKAVQDMVSGQYRSHFKGHGVQFSEHRVYQHGDDVRHIDWKASARSRDPLIKKFDEERELNVLLVVDLSASEGFGSKEKLKSEVVAEIGGMITYAGIFTGDRVGAILFSEEVEKIIPPKKGKQHVLRVVRELLGFRPKTKGTNLNKALEAAGRILKHSGVVFIISDFIDKDYEFQLKRLSRRHDVVAVWVGDQREMEIPKVGYMLLQDPETGVESLVDTSSYSFRNWFETLQRQQETQTTDTLTKSKVEILRIQTQDDYIEKVVKFFGARKRRWS